MYTFNNYIAYSILMNVCNRNVLYTTVDVYRFLLIIYNLLNA